MDDNSNIIEDEDQNPAPHFSDDQPSNRNDELYPLPGRDDHRFDDLPSSPSHRYPRYVDPIIEAPAYHSPTSSELLPQEDASNSNVSNTIESYSKYNNNPIKLRSSDFPRFNDENSKNNSESPVYYNNSPRFTENDPSIRNSRDSEFFNRSNNSLGYRSNVDVFDNRSDSFSQISLPHIQDHFPENSMHSFSENSPVSRNLLFQSPSRKPFSKEKQFPQLLRSISPIHNIDSPRSATSVGNLDPKGMVFEDGSDSQFDHSRNSEYSSYRDDFSNSRQFYLDDQLAERTSAHSYPPINKSALNSYDETPLPRDRLSEIVSEIPASRGLNLTDIINRDEGSLYTRPPSRNPNRYLKYPSYDRTSEVNMNDDDEALSLDNQPSSYFPPEEGHDYNIKNFEFNRSQKMASSHVANTVENRGSRRSVEEAALGLLGMNSNVIKTQKKVSQNRVSISNLLSNNDSDFPAKSSESHKSPSFKNRPQNENSIYGSNYSNNYPIVEDACAMDEYHSDRSDKGFYVESYRESTSPKNATENLETSIDVIRSGSIPHNGLSSPKDSVYSEFKKIKDIKRNSIQSTYSPSTKHNQHGLYAPIDNSISSDHDVVQSPQSTELISKCSSTNYNLDKTYDVLKTSHNQDEAPKKIVIQSIKLQGSSINNSRSSNHLLKPSTDTNKVFRSISPQNDDQYLLTHGETGAEDLVMDNYPPHSIEVDDHYRDLNSGFKDAQKINSNAIQPDSGRISDPYNYTFRKSSYNDMSNDNMSYNSNINSENEDSDEYLRSMTNEHSFYQDNDSESYKEYLNLRSKLAVQSYERRARKKRRRYHYNFMNKYGNKMPMKLFNEVPIFSSGDSCSSEDSVEFYKKNDKPISNSNHNKRYRLNGDASNHIINRVCSKLLTRNVLNGYQKASVSDFKGNYSSNPNSFNADYTSHIKGSIRSKFPHSSEGVNGISSGDLTPDYSIKNNSHDNSNHCNSYDNSPGVSSHNPDGKFSSKEKKDGIFLRISHLQKQVLNETSNLDTFKFPVSGPSSNEIIHQNVHIGKIENVADSQSNGKNLEIPVISSTEIPRSPFSFENETHIMKGKVNHPQISKLEAEIQLQKDLQKKKRDEIMELRSELRSVVLEHIPKAYKQYLLSVSSRQSNCRKVSMLCQREVRRSHGPSIIRGGPLSTLGDNRAPKEVITRARRSTREALFFWKRHEKEEREARKKAEKEALDKVKLEEEAREATRQSRKLNFLITQTELYSHFVGEKIKGEKSIGSKYSESKNMEELDFASATDEAIHERASINARAAMAKQLEKTKEFDGDRSGKLDVSDAVDSMNFQEPSTLGGSTETTQPKMMMCKLKEYQLKGLQWLASLYEQGINGILADEMGLGKTVQSISLMAYLAEVHGIWGPFMVVAPSSTLHNWQQEVSKFTPDFKILPYWGTQKDRKILRKSFWNLKHLGRRESPFHILITSYQLVVIDEPVLNRVKWQYMVLDEAQAIKSSSSARWKSLLQFKCRNRLLLTGTPIQNSMQELWALLHFIMPSLFDSHEEFSEWFSRDIEAHAENNALLNGHQLKRLHLILKPFMLRRIKKHVQHELGDKIEHLVPCTLTHRQAQMYSGLMKKVSISDLLARIQNTSSNSNESEESLMNLVMQFRKVCNHPELFERAEVESPFAFSNFSSSKINRSCSNSLYTPLKSYIVYHLPRIISEMVYNFEFSNDVKYRKFDGSKSLSRDLNLWNEFNIFSHSSPYIGMHFLRLCFDLKFSVSSPYSSIENFLGGLENYINHSSLLKTYTYLGTPGFETNVFDRVKWNSTGLNFVQFNEVGSILGLKNFQVIGSILDISCNIFNYSQSKTLPPAFKPNSVALAPELYSSGSSFAVASESFLLDHPLRSRLSFRELPCRLNNSFIIKPLRTKNYYNLSMPFLNHGSSPIWTPSVDKLIRYSGKMVVLDELLAKLKAENHRVLIYFQMTKMIDLMEEYLAYRQYTYLRLDGSSKISDRRNMVMDWQTRPEFFIFLLSTRAGGLGINLTAADTVIFYDSDWNPTVDQQAMDRAHRLGQTKQVTVYRLITQGTIEGRILERASQKNSIHKIVIAGGDTSTASGGLNQSESQPKPKSPLLEGPVSDSGYSNADSNSVESGKKALDVGGKSSNKKGLPENNNTQHISRPLDHDNDHDDAFAPTMMELKPNDIASLLLDESSGNDDKLWSEKLVVARNVSNDKSPMDDLLAKSKRNLSDLEQKNMSISPLSPLPTNTSTPASQTSGYIKGRADHYFDAYYASMELQNQLNKDSVNSKSSKKTKLPLPSKTIKNKRASKRSTARQKFSGQPSLDKNHKKKEPDAGLIDGDIKLDVDVNSGCN
ncbi:putative DNA helicase ino80 [Smittium mucronatum]|uniref:Chromatin-remodeling ATPase INO80 n=1 Tax=Smittium mucronatum TaxID=133383 RepID=A0A1R0GPJ6_9FUNG|nr:putative DNA helicase ino80 [Smittium mucronatum]